MNRDNFRLPSTAEGQGTSDGVAKESEGGLGELVDDVKEYFSSKGAFGGNDEGKLALSGFLTEIDKDKNDYPKILDAAEALVEKCDVKDLIALVRFETVDRSIYEHLLVRYLESKQYKDNPNFFKVAEALTELGGVNYSLKIEVRPSDSVDSPKIYFLLSKVESLFKEKSEDEIVDMVRKGEVHGSIVKRLFKERAKNQDEVGLKIARVIEKVADISFDDLFEDIEASLLEGMAAGKSVAGVIKEEAIDKDTLRVLLTDYQNGSRTDIYDLKKALAKYLLEENP
jgi:hypothetical protein